MNRTDTVKTRGRPPAWVLIAGHSGRLHAGDAGTTGGERRGDGAWRPRPHCCGENDCHGGEGTQVQPRQDVTPEARADVYRDDYRRAIDVAGGRARTELTRRPNFTFFQGPAPATTGERRRRRCGL